MCIFINIYIYFLKLNVYFFREGIIIIYIIYFYFDFLFNKDYRCKFRIYFIVIILGWNFLVLVGRLNCLEKSVVI